MKTAPTKLYTLISGLVIMLAGSMAFRMHEKPAKPKAATGFALIELFTSEGCSSCPAADDLVAKISREMTGKPVYVLAFHVDYWNRLGWKDPYSSADYSKRQYRYSEWLGLKGVYTPQIVVNGKTEFVGSDQGKLRKAIDSYSHQPAAAFNLQVTKLLPHQAELKYDTGTSTDTELLIAVVQKSTETKVERGENSGRTLAHVNVVRSLKHVPSGNGQSVKLNLPDGFNNKGWDIVGFVQNTQTGEVTAARTAMWDVMASAN